MLSPNPAGRRNPQNASSAVVGLLTRFTSGHAIRTATACRISGLREPLDTEIKDFLFPRNSTGDVAHMVERSLSMREVRGSIPRFSTDLFARPVKGSPFLKKIMLR